jgi:hypothetical protein
LTTLCIHQVPESAGSGAVPAQVCIQSTVTTHEPTRVSGLVKVLAVQQQV